MKNCITIISIVLLLPLLGNGQKVSVIEEQNRKQKFFWDYDIRSGVALPPVKHVEYHLFASFGARYSPVEDFSVTTSVFYNSVAPFAPRGVYQKGIKIALDKYITKDLLVQTGAGWSLSQSSDNYSNGFIDMSLQYKDVGVYIMYNPINKAKLGDTRYINLGLQVSDEAGVYTSVIAGTAGMLFLLIVASAIGT